MDMYKSIAWELGLPTERNRAAAFRQLRTEVSRLTQEAKQQPVLIIDEAHHLRNEVLEDLRLLTNYARQTRRTASVCCWWGSPSCAADWRWRCTSRWPNASWCAITSGGSPASSCPNT